MLQLDTADSLKMCSITLLYVKSKQLFLMYNYSEFCDGRKLENPHCSLYRTDSASGTQAYRIGKYADDQQKLEASLKRAVAMGLGVGALKEI